MWMWGGGCEDEDGMKRMRMSVGIGMIDQWLTSFELIMTFQEKSESDLRVGWGLGRWFGGV